MLEDMYTLSLKICLLNMSQMLRVVWRGVMKWPQTVGSALKGNSGGVLFSRIYLAIDKH